MHGGYRQIIASMVFLMFVTGCGDGTSRSRDEPVGEFELLRGPEISQARQLYREGKRVEGAAILRELIAHENWTVRSHAIRAIGDAGDQDLLSEVHGALEDNRLEVRESASRVLQHLGNRSSLKPLRRALSDTEGIVRSNSAEALARIGGAKELANLEPLLTRDEDPGVRAMTATALGLIHDPVVVPLLMAALADESTMVRARAAESLGDIGDERSRAALVKLATSDPDSGIRASASAALRRLDNAENQ
jgi:HEAT repeat protein